MGASKIWFFTYNPYFETVKIGLWQYSVIFFFLNIVAWLSSYYAQKIEDRFGERACIIGMILCVGVPIVLMGMLPFWPMAYLIMTQNVVRGFIKPFKDGYMNKHIDTDHIRTTVLSVQSSCSDMVSIATLFMFGLMNKYMSLLNSLVILGALVLILGAWIYRSYRKLPAQATT
jgi:MFS family permease